MVRNKPVLVVIMERRGGIGALDWKEGWIGKSVFAVFLLGLSGGTGGKKEVVEERNGWEGQGGGGGLVKLARRGLGGM